MSTNTLKGLSIEWLKHLETPEKKLAFAAKIRSFHNDIVIKRLVEILNEKRSSLLRGPSSLEDYDSPSWAHKQADINGQIRSLNLVLDLLGHNTKDTV